MAKNCVVRETNEYIFVPYDKVIVIVKDNQVEFAAMPKEIIKQFRENETMSNYLNSYDFWESS